MRPPLDLAFEDPSGAPGEEVRVTVKAGDRRIGTVWFRCRTEPLQPTGDVLFCMGLRPALELGCDLRLGAPVDRTLWANHREIQDTLRAWHPFYTPIEIEAELCDREYPAGRGTGLFFSGGVDSAYSLATARPRLDGLITIIGADVPVSDMLGADRHIAMAARVAEAYGLKSVVVETNIREVFRPFLRWMDYHGSAMAAVRHLLAGTFETTLFASSADESGWRTPWGSHPKLDPLFGSAGARIEHHGLAHRLAKVRGILDEPALMAELRICNKSYDNCGVCPKCRLTMSCLSVLDAFDRAPTFPADKEGAPGKFHLDPTIRSDMVNLREAAAATGRHAQLVAEIDAAVASYDRGRARQAHSHLPGFKRRLKRAQRQFRYWRAGR